MNYKETLKHPIVGRLSFIQLISYFGTWFSQVAIFSMLVGFGADEITIALTAAASMLPAVILAPLTGIIIDRIAFKKLMFLLLMTEIGMTLCFITINSLEYVWILMLLIFTRSAAAAMLFSAEMTLFSRILEGKMLKNTNEIHSIIWSFCYASGMAAGGLVTHRMGHDTAFVIDAALYCIAVILLIGLQLSSTHIDHTDSNWMMFKKGVRYLFTQKKILHLILLHASLGLTSFDALVTLLADLRYKEMIAVPLAIGWINATRAAALIIGPFFIGKWISKDTLHYFFLFQALGIMLWALFEFNFYLSLAAMFVTGFFTTTLWSYTYLLIQEETDKAFLGRIISYNDMFFMLSNVLTALFIGYSAKWGLSLEGITLILGCGFIFAAMYYLWFKKRYL